MKRLIKKIKQWRDRRFQQRVFKAIGISVINDAIVFDRKLQWKVDIGIYGLSNVQAFGHSFDGSAGIPTIDNDAIHDRPDEGVPV